MRLQFKDQDLVELPFVGILVIRDGKIAFANEVMATLSGIPREKLVDSPFVDFVHPDDRETAMGRLAPVLNGKTSDAPYALRMVDARGKTFWLDIVAQPMPDRDTPVMRIICRDITRRHQLERQLLQSEKMAAVGQLASGVAHEINNPVGFVHNNLHTLQDYQQDLLKLIRHYREMLRTAKTMAADDESAGLKRAIDTVEALEENIDIDFLMEDWPQLIRESLIGTNRIRDIIGDLKSFAHPGEQDCQRVNINASIASTLNLVWNELKYKAEVIRDFGEIPDLACFPQQLKQVFMNLLTNAGQAIGDKGEIKVRTRRREDYVEIAISDTGCGIADHDLEKIFDPFFTTKPVGTGTGLGLNVSYQIIKKHGGDIHVSSVLGQGTTFTVRLPLENDAPPEDAEPA